MWPLAAMRLAAPAPIPEDAPVRSANSRTDVPGSRARGGGGSRAGGRLGVPHRYTREHTSLAARHGGASR